LHTVLSAIKFAPKYCSRGYNLQLSPSTRELCSRANSDLARKFGDMLIDAFEIMLIGLSHNRLT
jgi:hypothetical protein